MSGKSESAKTSYREMRAADARRSSNIVSGYPAIKRNEDAREGGGILGKESIENNYRRSDIHARLYRVRAERLSAKPAAAAATI